MHGALLLDGAADEVAQERRQLAGVDAVGAVGEHRAEEVRLVDVLELPVADLGGRDQAGQQQQRHAVEVGVDDAGRAR